MSPGFCSFFVTTVLIIQLVTLFHAQNVPFTAKGRYQVNFRIDTKLLPLLSDFSKTQRCNLKKLAQLFNSQCCRKNAFLRLSSVFQATKIHAPVSPNSACFFLTNRKIFSSMQSSNKSILNHRYFCMMIVLTVKKHNGAVVRAPMWPGFNSRCRRHMWVEFVVGSRPCSERFFSGYSGFPLSSKTNTSKFQFDLESVPN